MSLRARTSAPDYWMQVKVQEKCWDLCDMTLMRYRGERATFTVVVSLFLLAHSVDCNIFLDCMQPRAVRVLCACGPFLTPLWIQWDRRETAAESFAESHTAVNTSRILEHQQL